MNPKVLKALLPFFLLIALVAGACNLNTRVDVTEGSGRVTSQTREVSNFDRVVLNGIGDVTITQGNTEKLDIEAEDNIIPHILTSVSNGTLNISFDKKAFVPTKSIKFNLTMRDIHGLESKGVSNIQASQIKTDSLVVAISGTGNINLDDLTADRLNVTVSGAGNLTGQGQVDQLTVNLSGAGNYNGQDIKSKTANITIAGIGRVVAWVTDNLSVVISGTGGVDYYGDPKVSQQISGLGSLKRLGNK